METIVLDKWLESDEEEHTTPSLRSRERRPTTLERPTRLRPKTETINTVRKESKQTLPCILSMDPVVALRNACGQNMRPTLFAHIESLVAFYHEQHIREVLVFLLSLGEDVITPIHAAYLEVILHGDLDVEDLQDLTQFVEDLQE